VENPMALQQGYHNDALALREEGSFLSPVEQKSFQYVLRDHDYAPHANDHVLHGFLQELLL